MSVTADVVLKVDTTTLRQGTIKFWGNMSVAGDGTGGSYFIGFTADPTMVQMFPGRNYWIITGISFYSGGALANSAIYFIWFTFENGNLYHSVYAGSGFNDTVSDGGVTRLWTDGRQIKGFLPHRWRSIDTFYSGVGYVVRTRIDPNTNGVTAGCMINGLICNEDYILRHGLFLPS